MSVVVLEPPAVRVGGADLDRPQDGGGVGPSFTIAGAMRYTLAGRKAVEGWIEAGLVDAVSLPGTQTRILRDSIDRLLANASRPARPAKK